MNVLGMDYNGVMQITQFKKTKNNETSYQELFDEACSLIDRQSDKVAKANFLRCIAWLPNQRSEIKTIPENDIKKYIKLYNLYLILLDTQGTKNSTTIFNQNVDDLSVGFDNILDTLNNIDKIVNQHGRPSINKLLNILSENSIDF